MEELKTGANNESSKNTMELSNPTFNMSRSITGGSFMQTISTNMIAGLLSNVLSFMTTEIFNRVSVAMEHNPGSSRGSSNGYSCKNARACVRESETL